MTQELPKTADAVIIGGGVMGTSTAYHLARKGAKNVLLVEKEPFFGVMSTGQCAGGIRHQFSSDINIRLSIDSIRMLERFPEEMGQDVDLRFTGYLFLLTHEQDVATFRQNVALQHSLGVMTHWLEPDEIVDMLPVLNLEGVRAGTFYERDGLCDPASVVQGYVTNARRLGARLFTDTKVVDIRTLGERVTAVETDQGVVQTPVVVNACGAWAAQIGRMVGVDIPIEPIRRQIVVTTPIPELPSDFPFVIFFHEALYFHREGEGILTGKSNPDESVGYRLSVDPEWEMVHMDEAMVRMPALEKAGLLSHWAGLYEVTPDAHPILGRIPTLEGFYAMAGFSGHGFMHGPMVGLLMAEEILDGHAHTVDIAPFRYDRFLAGELYPEYNVV
ncbi:MAG: FAD-binding oxidoreductase [Anaerolineae bacterium]|jgi:sarcosine oxidase subunit beta